jgi:hypothetical protein
VAACSLSYQLREECVKKIITVLVLLIVFSGCDIPVVPQAGQGWSQAAYLSSAIELQWNGYPDVAISSSGNAWIAWGEGWGEGSQISAKNYNPGSGWKNTVPIATGSNTLITEVIAPRVMMDSSGNAGFVYMRNNYYYCDILTVSVSANNSWSGQELLTGINAVYWQDIWSDRPEVTAYDCAMSPGGNACVAWPWDLSNQDAGPLYYSVWANYNTGAGWSTYERCSENFTQDHPLVKSVHVLYDKNEVPWTFWLQATGTPGYCEIWYTHPPLTDPVIPTTEYPGIDSNPPQYAVDEYGNPFIAWITSEDQADGTHYQIRFVRMDGSSFTSSVPVIETTANIYAFLLVNDPNTGTIGLMWKEHDADTGAYALKFKQHTGDGTWGDTTTVIQEPDIDGYNSFSASFDGAGNAIMCWERNDTGTMAIWVAHYVAGQGLTDPQKIESSDGGMNPALAVSANGMAVVVWHEAVDGYTSRIKASVYHP